MPGKHVVQVLLSSLSATLPNWSQINVLLVCFVSSTYIFVVFFVCVTCHGAGGAGVDINGLMVDVGARETRFARRAFAGAGLGGVAAPTALHTGRRVHGGVGAAGGSERVGGWLSGCVDVSERVGE